MQVFVHNKYVPGFRLRKPVGQFVENKLCAVERVSSPHT